MQKSNNKVNFSWDIHWKCNYRCPYCWWYGRWEELCAHNYYPGIDRLIEVWERIYRLYGCVHIEITGGEPLIYPHFIDFLLKILKYHTVGITTNLSGDVEEIVKKLKDDGNQFGIGATFHPLFADFNEFIKKAKFLRKNNFFPNILYLAWPPQIKDIPLYKSQFENNGFSFSILTFWGECQGKSYPDSYTDEEKKIINLALGKRAGENFQIKPIITEGRNCNAGHTYATIQPDGTALRCGGGGWGGKNITVGNIFSDKFFLWDEPRACHSKYCPCNEWAFLLTEKI